MKIAILGSGGREHAIAWKFAKSVPKENIYVLPGNGGTWNNVNIQVTEFDKIKAFCLEKSIDLVFVGPEVPLAQGIVDFFKDTDIKVFGPAKAAAQLESSKIFAKKFMVKHGVATADFWLFDSVEAAKELVYELNGDLVIKYDGLAGGKGVYVCSSIPEALEALKELVTQYGKSVEFLIERKLQGQELSIIGFTDGKTIKLLHPAQDHKQAFDGDKGPNTGGMGTFCPVPFCDEKLLATIKRDIVEPTIKGIQAENFDCKGIIFFGIMMGENGPMTLEYNMRLGDPETEIILPAMKTDLATLVMACFDGSLATIDIELEEGYFVDVVLTSGGYPKKYTKGYKIKGLDTVSEEEALIFHAGTKVDENNTIVTNGGRVLNLVAHGKTLAEAIEKAYAQVKKVSFKDVHYRTDIGTRNL